MSKFFLIMPLTTMRC